jgi:predicted transcriptional regulator
MAEAKVLNSAVLDYILQERTDLTSSEKLVTITLLNHRNTKTLQCFPTRRTLAREAALTRLTVDRCVSALIEKKVIVRIRSERKDDGRLGGDRYAFRYDALTVLCNGVLGGVKGIEIELLEQASGYRREDLQTMEQRTKALGRPGPG